MFMKNVQSLKTIIRFLLQKMVLLLTGIGFSKRNKMTVEDFIINLFKKLGLGDVALPIENVFGGFMHRMYKVTVGGTVGSRSFAVKHLNPEIMKRPQALANYARAEKIESILEQAGFPLVPALVFDDRKMQAIGGNYFYIFDWHDAKVTDWDNITDEQCFLAGEVLGRIHAVDFDLEESGVEHGAPELSQIDWMKYVKQARESKSEIASLMQENLELLEYAQNQVNEARQNLPDIIRISDEDMDPKNVMWENGKPLIIDLECLDYGNPASHVLQLALQWSGITTCNLKLNLVRSFFEGYHKAYDNGFHEYQKIFGLAYTWIEWLEYNIQRSLGACADEAEKQMGVEQVQQTINRIKYLREKEDLIKKEL